MGDVVSGPGQDGAEDDISSIPGSGESVENQGIDETVGAFATDSGSGLEPGPLETTRELEPIDFASPQDVGDAGHAGHAGDAAEPAELSLVEAAATMDSARVLGRERRARRRRRIKLALLSITATTALGAATIFGLAAWDIQHLTHNLKHTALLPAGFTEPAEPVDAYGRSPINILVLGSDTRDTTQDCDLGGDCTQGSANSGANADSEMIVHLSADRSNVTVL